MIATIKSPFIPLFIKQKIIEENENVGFLKATNLMGQLRGNQSYQVEYKEYLIKLIEAKKENGNRIWNLKQVTDGIVSRIGSLTLASSTKETLSKGYTVFQLKYGEEIFMIKKPYMYKKNYCELRNSNGEKIAVHLKQKYLSLKREIKVEESRSAIEGAIFILTLSLIIFIA